MQILENISLRDLNTFGVEQQTRYFCSINDASDLAKLSEFVDRHNLPLLTLGGGSNILLSGDFPGVVAKIALSGTRFEEKSEQRLLHSAAGENWHQLVMRCIEHGWQGLENLALIPGSAGAAPIQNIGAYGLELEERFESLQAYNLITGSTDTFNKADCAFSYRDSYFKSHHPGQYIITSISLSLPLTLDWRLDYAGLKEAVNQDDLTSLKVAEAVIKLRQSKLPDHNKIGNAGSFFKNPIIEQTQLDQLLTTYPDLPVFRVDTEQVKISAGWMIEQAGLKGYREDDAGVSERHALVLVNYGNAKGSHILGIANTVIDTVHKKFGIRLEPEPKVV